MERAADYFDLKVGDLVVLRTKLNPKSEKIVFPPAFPSFDRIINENADYMDMGWPETIRVFRPVNNGFSLDHEGEEWLAKVSDVKVGPNDKRTTDNRIYVYIYVWVMKRKEKTRREYRFGLYVEETISGNAVLKRREIGKLVVDEQYFQHGGFILRGRTISSDSGELLMVEVFGKEIRNDYFRRRVAEIKNSPFAGTLGIPEEVIEREIASFQGLPSDKVSN